MTHSKSGRRGLVLLSIATLAIVILPSQAKLAGSDDPKKGKEVFDKFAVATATVNPVASALFKGTGEFLDICGYFGNSPDPVGDAINRINQRLDALELRMAAVEAKVQQVQNELFRTQNLARIRKLRDFKDRLQGILDRLQPASKDKNEKIALARDAQRIAEKFLYDVDPDLWVWSDLVLQDLTWQDVSMKGGTMLEPDFKPWPTLEYYTLALVTWMTAAEYAGEGNTAWVKQTFGADIQRHIAFLSMRPNWNPTVGPPATLPEEVRSRIAGWFVPDKYPENMVCHFGELTTDKIGREIRYIYTYEYPAKRSDELCTVPQGFWNQPTAAEQELERAYGTDLMWSLADRLGRLKNYGTVKEQFVGTFSAASRTIVPAFLYAVRPDGQMSWYRHDGAEQGTNAWVGGTKVGSDWAGFKQVIPGGANIIESITKEGKHYWYRHNGFNTGAMDAGGDSGTAMESTGPPRNTRAKIRKPGDPPAVPAGPRQWNGAKEIGSGWDGFKQVFAGGNGVVYAITKAGKLMYYRHTGHKEGEKLWEPAKEVGSGWGNFKTVFSGGDGILYAVTYEGKLMWYKQIGFAQGAKSWMPAKEIKAKGPENWADYKFVFSAGPRTFGTPDLPRVALDKVVIYAIDAQGRLWWYGHRGYNVGASFLDDRRLVGTGWGDFVQVFALLPDAADVVR